MISFEPVDGFFLNLHGHITETSFSADYILCLYDLPIFKVIVGLRYFHFELFFSITSGWKVIRLLCIYNYDMEN